MADDYTVECVGVRNELPIWVLRWRIQNPELGAALHFSAFKVVADVSGQGDLNLQIEFLVADGVSEVIELADAARQQFPPMSSVMGYVKWDGCCNVDLPDHFCGAHEVQDATDLLLHCYRLAAQHIAGWDGGTVPEGPGQLVIQRDQIADIAKWRTEELDSALADMQPTREKERA